MHTESVDIALLFLRLVLALLLTGHACQKLFGWFRGLGVSGTASIFEANGLKPGRLMVVIAGVTESVAAVLLALGLVTPLAVTMVLGAMIVAAATLLPNGLWAHLGGYEVPLAYATVAFTIGIVGPGRYAIDALTPWREVQGPVVALTTLAVAALFATPLVVAALRSQRRRSGGRGIV